MSTIQAPEDAYTEYVKRRREQANADPEVTLTLLLEEIQAIGGLILKALEVHAELPLEERRFWLSILRKFDDAARDAVNGSV